MLAMKGKLMKHISKIQLHLTIVILVFTTSACGLVDLVVRSAAPTPVPVTSEVGQVTQPPSATLTAAATPTATAGQLPTSPQPTVEVPTYSGFVVFIEEYKEFQTYNLDGEMLQRIAAPSFQAFSRDQVDVIGDNIYYYARDDEHIFLANDSGLTALIDQPAKNPFGFKISADEKQIAWSVVTWDSIPIVSELWVGNLDGSSASRVATYNSDQSPAFLFIPIEWTPDGKLLFNRSPTGFGGYILYGGYNSLYSYDPASQQVAAYVPAEELHGLCLDHYRLDLGLVAFNCGNQGSQIILRNLSNGSETRLQNLPDYPITGSVRFSPSGEWLAYAAAKGNPDAEAGQLLVQPANLSAEPVQIASVEGGFFVVQTWLSENSLLVTRNEGMESSILSKIERDGSRTQDLARGWFVMMTP
jgi:hypothetical protein